MSSLAENKVLACRYFEGFANPDVFYEIVSADFTVHPIHRVTLTSDDERGPEPLKQGFLDLLTSFPDSRATVDDVLAEEDRVLVLWTYEGTQSGEFWGIPPSGKAVRYRGINLFRVENGKLAEGWDLIDRLAMWQQLGLVPETRDFIAQARKGQS